MPIGNHAPNLVCVSSQGLDADGPIQIPQLQTSVGGTAESAARRPISTDTTHASSVAPQCCKALAPVQVPKMKCALIRTRQCHSLLDAQQLHMDFSIFYQLGSGSQDHLGICNRSQPSYEVNFMTEEASSVRHLRLQI